MARYWWYDSAPAQQNSMSLSALDETLRDTVAWLREHHFDKNRFGMAFLSSSRA
jgi:hypothetical protein